ncbi:retrovirus-related pol polyprotein from transposon TNT 1-94 [Tanacetum coccineum]
MLMTCNLYANSEPISNALVKHSVRNAKFESMCAICNKCLFDATHDMYLIDHVNDVNVCSKSKSKRNKKRKVWKPTGKVFTEIGYSWKPTGRNFTIIGNRCPLTRITSNKIVPPKETTISPVVTPTSRILVYSRRQKATRFVGSSSKVKIVDSNTPNTTKPNQSWGSTVFDVPSSSHIDYRLFGNDHIAKIMGYGDFQMGNVTISRVYYVEGLGHNLFSVGQFCDSDLEVTFRKHTCFVRDLKGVDLLKGSRGSNLYTLSLENLMLSSPICFLSKASKTKSWLWHRRLSHLNFNYINYLAKQGLVRGLPKLKYQKDHLCSACALGKSKKHSHKPKAVDSIQEKLYLLHMDLCGPMRVQSINGRKYILVIVDDFSRTDNGTEFVNQTLRAYYKEVRISHQTSVARTLNRMALSKDRTRHFSGVLEPLKTLYLNASPSVDRQVLAVPALEPVVSTGTPLSTTIDQYAPSTSTSQTPSETPSPVIPLGVEEADHDIEVAHMDNNPFVEFLILEPSFEESSTQELVPLLDRVMIITLKWIYKVKLDELGGVLKNKARLVAKGYRREEGIDLKNLLLQLLDSSPSEVYVSQPDGFVDTENPNHVYKLKKALYGLKQALRTWYNFLSSFLLSQKFTKGSVDPTLFVRREGKDILLVQVYVDDIIFASTKPDLWNVVDPTCYRGMIGTLMYLTSSRPDLVFVVCMCARYQAKPTEKHLHAVKRIFRYLRGTINMGLWYLKDSCIALTAFADADHAGCQDTRKSTFRSMQLLGDRLEQVENGMVKLYFVITKYQLADIFTKPLARERLDFLIKKSNGGTLFTYPLIMATTVAQQIALDNALVIPEKQVKIGKCNMRIDPEITPKEPTYQVVLDTLALTTCYLTFLITASVLICPRLLDKEFDDLPSEEEIISFIKDLGHTGNVKKITDVVIDHMHQPWRDFATIINNCLSGKITGLDKIRLSRAQILCGMYHNKNIDFVELLWEDFKYQIDNKDFKKKEKMYYPRFTKAIIHHFLSKDKSISMRNKMFMHTAQDDCTLGNFRFVSKDEDTQVYGALIPAVMANQMIQDFTAYQTYFAFATREATPKPKRIYKKTDSPTIKTTTKSSTGSPSKKNTAPAKKDVSLKMPLRKHSTGVQIRDTPGVSVSKKAPVTTDKSKGIELLSEAALLEDAQIKKALKKSKRDKNIHQTSGSSEGADFESQVPNEPKGKSTDISEGTGMKPGVPDMSKAYSSNSDDDGDNDASDEEKTESDDDQNNDDKVEEYEEEYVM